MNAEHHPYMPLSSFYHSDIQDEETYLSNYEDALDHEPNEDNDFMDVEIEPWSSPSENDADDVIVNPRTGDSRQRNRPQSARSRTRGHGLTDSAFFTSIPSSHSNSRRLNLTFNGSTDDSNTTSPTTGALTREMTLSAYQQHPNYEYRRPSQDIQEQILRVLMEAVSRAEASIRSGNAESHPRGSSRRRRLGGWRVDETRTTLSASDDAATDASHEEDSTPQRLL